MPQLRVVSTLTLSTPGFWDMVISWGRVLRTRTPENDQNGPYDQFLSDGKSLLQVGLSVCLSVGRSVRPQNEIQNEIQKATNNICTQKLHIIKPSLRRGALALVV